MSVNSSTTELVVFLGPSLPAAEARQIAPCTVLPPARQGDVWRAMSLRPKAIALIDGVFEAVPSVWHHELLDALDSGIAVFGASSMGALRAAELAPWGMRGVGRIFQAYRRGELLDDAEVALLHASAEHGFRPMTVPLVTVRETALRARRTRALKAAEAATLVAAGEALFYQERSWPAVLRRTGWPEERVGRFRAWLAEHPVDPKAEDARECIAQAAKWLASGRTARRETRSPRRPSSLVRRRRLFDDDTLGVGGERLLAALWRRKDADDLVEAGLRRALLAGWARQQGLRVSDEELDAAMAEWADAVGDPDAALDAERMRPLVEDALLEARMLEHASRMLPDGPGADEALASEARLNGLWHAAARSLGKKRRR